MNSSIFSIKCPLPPLPVGYPISAKVVLDSVFPWKKGRLTTLELVFPRYILAELATHRTLSKNTSSSRAIPTAKAIADSSDVYPVRWGKNQRGMQPSKENLSLEDQDKAATIWAHMMETCKEGCAELAALGLHKQWASRPLEWFSTVKMVVSATQWENMFKLRDHSAAQDEIAYLIQAIKVAMGNSVPQELKEGEWHIPYVEDIPTADLLTKLKVSAARCARTSYKTFLGVNSTFAEDFELFSKLHKGSSTVDDDDDPFHASPTEHQARELTFEEATEKFMFVTNNFSPAGPILQFRQCIESPREYPLSDTEIFVV